MGLTAERLEDYARLSSQLKQIEKFISDNNVLTYMEFDYLIVNEMTLFALEPNFNFDTLNQNIEVIKNSIQSIKNIFTKPIIILKDSNDVLPVENVRTINQETLQHLSTHTQNVSNISKKRVVPRKLLTRVYEDDYSIYENVVFCNFIDEISSYIRKTSRILSNLLYTNEILSFNLLEKVNHVNYYLALGKLHTGYKRDYSQYFIVAKKCVEEMGGIQRTIGSYLKRPIYQKNKNRNTKIPLKKTNIFLMQKDYKRIFKSYKYMINNIIPSKNKEYNLDFELIKTNYLSLIKIITIFSLGHLNFKTKSKETMNLTSINSHFTYKGWSVDIMDYDNSGVILKFNKTHEYSILLLPRISQDEENQDSQGQLRADEVLYCSPFFKPLDKREDIYLSMDDIDSFRRAQQIILRGMIYSDSVKDTCPFCGEKLTNKKNHNYYECDHCMMQIKKDRCPLTNNEYYYTDIANKDFKLVSQIRNGFDIEWLNDKKTEAMMYYRNITKINEDNSIICPYCSKAHVNN